MQAEGRIEDRLAVDGTREPEGDAGEHELKQFSHRRSVPRFALRRKCHKERECPARVAGGSGFPVRRRRRAAGSVLLEATLSMVVLVVVGLSLLKISINITAPRQWTLQQTISDSYLTYEKAFAQRAEFDTLSGDESPWPEFPSSADHQVELGKLPGGRAIMGTITRTRRADPNNFPVHGGTGTLASNPAGIEGWKLQSILRYQVGGLSYAKSRTVVRSQ